MKDWLIALITSIHNKDDKYYSWCPGDISDALYLEKEFNWNKSKKIAAKIRDIGILLDIITFEEIDTKYDDEDYHQCNIHLTYETHHYIKRYNDMEIVIDKMI